MARHERYWEEYVRVYHKSGLSVVVFCLQNNLKTKTFYKWLKRDLDVFKQSDDQKGSALKAPDAKASVSKTDSKSLHPRLCTPSKKIYRGRKYPIEKQSKPN